MQNFPTLQPINPFYSARSVATPATMARLPKAPLNASPVPHLTSLYHHTEPGDYGDRSYPGNCGGNLIKDLLRYFQPKSVFDPMTGSGTCRDVCQELELPCESTDLRAGFDACDPRGFECLGPIDFIWAHPPYWRQKLYSASPLCLSRTSSLQEFERRYSQFLQNCANTLEAGGHLAVLMGDYSDRDTGFISLTHMTKQLAFKAGLRQACTDIIRFSHGATSSRKVYRSSFIPGLHDVCMVFVK